MLEDKLTKDELIELGAKFIPSAIHSEAVAIVKEKKRQVYYLIDLSDFNIYSKLHQGDYKGEKHE